MSCYFITKTQGRKNTTSLEINITDGRGIARNRKIWTISIAKLTGRKKLILRPLIDEFFQLYDKVYRQKEIKRGWRKAPFLKNETLCFIFETPLASLTEAQVRGNKLIVFVAYRMNPKESIYFLDLLQDPDIWTEKQKSASNLLRKLACKEKARQIFLRSRNRCSPKDGTKANFLQVDIK